MDGGGAMKLSEHFSLAEFLPDGMKVAPAEVVANLRTLSEILLEPLRAHFGLPVVIHHNGGYRPPEVNAAVGGVPLSDHQRGAAADFHVSAGGGHTWEWNTIAAFYWLVSEKSGEFGQIILEDHRHHTGEPGKLWVHLALKSPKHPGTPADRNRLLVSYEPKKYEAWKETRDA